MSYDSGSELIRDLVGQVHDAAMNKLDSPEAEGWSTARRSAWADGVIFAKQILRDVAKEPA
jgi:hypothetical protein